jgi:lipid-binding SYLF domain-containing protein
MKRIHLSALISALLFAPVCLADDISKDEYKKLQEEVPTTIANFKGADSTIGTFFEKSAGYAVLPRIAKGGFIVGGARGTGLVYEKGKLIGHVVMSQASIGAQIGGQSFSEVIFFENADALKTFQNSEFTMSAQVGAVAASEGVAKNAKYQQGVAIFTLARTGLMAEASVGGQKFKFTPAKE